MHKVDLKQTLSQIYLSLVPIVLLIVGLAVGYSSYKIYVPVWLANVTIMILCTRTLCKAGMPVPDKEKMMMTSGIFFIVPLLFTSMFAGLGAPPFDDPLSWVKSDSEQRVRYYFLIIVGFCIVIGFTFLEKTLKKSKETFYSALGALAIKIAIPIYMINQTFWGFYYGRISRLIVETNIGKFPDWAIPLRTQFYYSDVIVCALVYLGTAFFAMSLQKTGIFKKTACTIYIAVSILFFLLDFLPGAFRSPWIEPFGTLNFLVSIPAIPFMISYYMGINLLKRAGK